MRFVDANIFVYAFLEPKRRLTEREAALKQRSKDIVRRIDKGEQVRTAIVQITEVCNIMESRAPPEQAHEIIQSILFSNSIDIVAVDTAVYAAALELARTHAVSVNDGVAAVVMEQNSMQEIYSHDTDFDKIPGITRIDH